MEPSVCRVQMGVETLPVWMAVVFRSPALLWWRSQRFGYRSTALCKTCLVVAYMRLWLGVGAPLIRCAKSELCSDASLKPRLCLLSYSCVFLPVLMGVHSFQEGWLSQEGGIEFPVPTAWGGSFTLSFDLNTGDVFEATLPASLATGPHPQRFSISLTANRTARAEVVVSLDPVEIVVAETEGILAPNTSYHLALSWVRGLCLLFVFVAGS
jgi:hypothetical protein